MAIRTHKPTGSPFVLLVIVLLLAVEGFSQDTIYVYETIHVSDTVWVEAPVQRDTTPIHALESIDDATLLIDTINQKGTLVYFSSNKSATIPINHIYTNRNQLKSANMKKAGFFTLMFLAVQSISFGQPEFSVKAGVSHFWLGNFTNYSYGMIWGDHEGVEIKTPIGNNIALGMGIELHGYGKMADFIKYDDDDGLQVNSYTIEENHRSIPVSLYYTIKRLEILGGIEYRFIDSFIGFARETIDGGYRNELGIILGMEYALGDNVSLLSKIYLGNNLSVNTNSSPSYMTREGSNCFDLSLKYYINRKSDFLIKKTKFKSPRYY